MTTVLAALDADASARPVLSTAIAIAPLFDATATALHVPENGASAAENLARASGVELRKVSGVPIDQIVAATQDPDVAALVLGARGVHGGPQPAGHTALDVITRVPKPIVVVPPHAEPPEELALILAPLEGSSRPHIRNLPPRRARTVRMWSACAGDSLGRRSVGCAGPIAKRGRRSRVRPPAVAGRLGAPPRVKPFITGTITPVAPTREASPIMPRAIAANSAPSAIAPATRTAPFRKLEAGILNPPRHGKQRLLPEGHVERGRMLLLRSQPLERLRDATGKTRPTNPSSLETLTVAVVMSPVQIPQPRTGSAAQADAEERGCPTATRYSGACPPGTRRVRASRWSSKDPIGMAANPSATACSSTFCATWPASSST